RLDAVAAATEMTRTVVGRRGVGGGFGVIMMVVLLICGCDSHGGGVMSADGLAGDSPEYCGGAGSWMREVMCVYKK
nr:hypothetical protein [Tanacetum cinerariifolium]